MGVGRAGDGVGNRVPPGVSEEEGRAVKVMLRWGVKVPAALGGEDTVSVAVLCQEGVGWPGVGVPGSAEGDCVNEERPV